MEMSQQNLPCLNPHQKSCAHSEAGLKLESLQFLQQCVKDLYCESFKTPAPLDKFLSNFYHKYIGK